jgi:hypothetical protein
MLCLKDQKFMKMYPDGNLLQWAPLLWCCCGYGCANDIAHWAEQRKVAPQCVGGARHRVVGASLVAALYLALQCTNQCSGSGADG